MRYRPLACAIAMILFSTAARAQTPPPAGAPSGDPLVKSWTPPVYPPELEKQNVEGRVELRFVVSETGEVGKLRVAKSSDKRFNEAALESVGKWVFAPGLDEGKPIPMGMGVRLFFKLSEIGTAGLLPPSESTPYPLKKTPPKIVSQPVETTFPAWLESRITKGTVFADLMIDAGGMYQGCGCSTRRIPILCGARRRSSRSGSSSPRNRATWRCRERRGRHWNSRRGASGRKMKPTPTFLPWRRPKAFRLTAIAKKNRSG
ncbi:hypothetical protein CKA38_14895 [Ereboglobus luteus]|uniref:TonB C-terminal domain-containing protein n=1 Tax=Ereboglobus luteus TaxID=1796921 RepID=A0A2U8E781_9BACT|nr:hypothetical protein CKA38_14895 [Ereboglobus luteus]